MLYIPQGMIIVIYIWEEYFMHPDERRKSWEPDTTIYEITRFFKMEFIPPALREVEGAEGWIDLHLRFRQGSLDIAKEAMVCTQEGKAYPVCIEGTAHVQPTDESRRAGIWQAGDCLLVVSGVPYESLQAGDLLVQEKNAKGRAPRVWKSRSS
jgi:hypothetical protein